MTLSNKPFPLLPPAANSKRLAPARMSGHRASRPAALVSVAGVAAVVAALWMAFDLPAQDPRSLLVSLTPVAAMKCVSSRILAAECVTTGHAPAKAEQASNR